MSRRKRTAANGLRSACAVSATRRRWAAVATGSADRDGEPVLVIDIARLVEAFGVNVPLLLTLTYALGAGLAGFAGATVELPVTITLLLRAIMDIAAEHGFDPDSDDTEVVRTVALLLRTVAIAASVRTGDAEIDTAEEKIGEAVTQLDKIDTIKKAAGSIQKGAAKIESECTSITTAIRRLLDQALVALAGRESGPGQTVRPSAEDAA